MLILGDFAYPFSDFNDNLLKSLPTSFLEVPKVVNFESTMASINRERVAKGIAIKSSDLSLDFLNKLNVVGVTLSNNHIFDYDYALEDLLRKFHSVNIKTVGVGNCLGSSAEPMLLKDFAIFNFGWDVIGCKSASKTHKGTNPLHYKHIKRTISQYIKDKKCKRKVIVIFHWNYEFELYPQPAHRCLSKELIDLGVDAIIGHHSHIIQGAELYKGKPIVYGLGNFYLPIYDFDGYILKFPDAAYTGLGVDINTTDFSSYLVNSTNNELKVSGIKPLFEREEVKQVSSFAGMSDHEYLKFFKMNRKKKKLLPIYDNFGIKEEFFNCWVRSRQLIIDFFVRRGLKKHV